LTRSPSSVSKNQPAQGQGPSLGPTVAPPMSYQRPDCRMSLLWSPWLPLPALGRWERRGGWPRQHARVGLGARGRRDLQRLDRQKLVEASRMELKAATAAAAPRAGLRVRGAGGVIGSS